MAYIETTSGAQFSNAQAITATANSTNVFDVTGAGAGNAPAMIGAGGVNTAMGVDIGAGDGMAIPEVQLVITTATTVTGTLTVALQAAPDNGSYSPGTYESIYTSAAFTGATQLPLNGVLTFQVPPIPPGLALPRFYRLVYTVTGSISVVVSAALLLNPPLQRDATLYGNNFVSV